MRGDFTRDPLKLRDRRKHFTRVLMQQGRVQLDADWNEQAAILLYYLQTLAVDLIGPHGGPADHCGFGIVVDSNDLDEREQQQLELLELELEQADFFITTGHYYVDGLLCENDTLCTYNQQPDYPRPPSEELENETYMVYLDVWERHVTYLEDEAIREVALGGPDTTTRAQLVWQVKVVPVEWSEEEDVEGQLEALEKELMELKDKLATAEAAGQEELAEELAAQIEAIEERIDELEGVTDYDALLRQKLEELGKLGEAELRARAYLGSSPEDPCITPPQARYRGAENQLYRVEVHRDGSAWDGVGNAEGAATFKWSRDNGSVVAAWVGQEGDDLVVSGVRDTARGFAAGQWVELTDDELELRGEPGTMVRVVKAEGDRVTIDPETASDGVNWSGEFKNPEVRRWDQGASRTIELSSGAVLIEESKWLDLEDGIKIQFEQGGTYHTGDYWLIPARTATGDVEWPGPVDAPEAVPPHGVEHHYAPLAIISFNGTATKEKDCRYRFELTREQVS